MKVIKKTHNQQEARIIVGYLNANGVDAELLDGAMNALLPVMTAVRIAVPDEQETQAYRLINEVQRTSADNS